MVKDHSDSERGNPLPPHRLLFPISSIFYMHHPTEHWLEREIAQWVHPMKDRSDDPSHHERTLLPRSYISILQYVQMYVCIHTNFYVYIGAYMHWYVSLYVSTRKKKRRRNNENKITTMLYYYYYYYYY